MLLAANSNGIRVVTTTPIALFLLIVGLHGCGIHTTDNSSFFANGAWSSEPRIVCGQRCLWVPRRTSQTTFNKHQNGKSQDSSAEQLLPPLVLVGGLGQTIASYQAHLPALSKERSVLLYECIGQGKRPLREGKQQYIQTTDTSSDNDYYSNVTLPFQAERLLETVQHVLSAEHQSQENRDSSMETEDDDTRPSRCRSFDLVGFSLGARVCLAAACVMQDKEHDDAMQNKQQQPFQRIRRLHLTGVATERSVEGQLALHMWKEQLGGGGSASSSATSTKLQDDGEDRGRCSLEAFAWSALQTTYGGDFLYANRDRLSTWVQFLCRTNSCRGIRALLDQAHPESDKDPWHVQSMAKRLARNSSAKQQRQKQQGHLVVGELDVMAPPEKVQELARLLDWSSSCVEVIANCGHAVPMQAGRAWRSSVLDFLNKEP